MNSPVSWIAHLLSGIKQPLPFNLTRIECPGQISMEWGLLMHQRCFPDKHEHNMYLTVVIKKFIWTTSMSIVRTFKQKLIGRLIINIACPFHKDTAKLVQVLGLLPMIWLRFNLTSITFPIVDSCLQTSQCNNPNWTINQNTSTFAYCTQKVPKWLVTDCHWKAPHFTY